MEKTLSVAAIKDGTVIDHITAGYALPIIRLLHLVREQRRVTVGLNLVSKRMGNKDLIKVENRQISADEANQIAIFSPHATISIIANFQVTKKFTVSLPESITGVVPCPNPACITNHEPMSTRFYPSSLKHTVQLRCAYCEKVFAREEIGLNS